MFVSPGKAKLTSKFGNVSRDRAEEHPSHKEQQWSYSCFYLKSLHEEECEGSHSSDSSLLEEPASWASHSSCSLQQPLAGLQQLFCFPVPPQIAHSIPGDSPARDTSKVWQRQPWLSLEMCRRNSFTWKSTHAQAAPHTQHELNPLLRARVVQGQWPRALQRWPHAVSPAKG